MTKKFLAIFAAISMLFSITPSAQAAGSLTQTDKASFANGLNNVTLVQVTPTLKVALWAENSNSGILYTSAVVSADGHLGERIQFGSSGTTEFMPNFKFAVSPNGLLTVVYRYSRDLGNNSSAATLRVVFTDDGAHWSAPIAALPEVTGNFFCDPLIFSCAYEAKNLIYDSLGHLILLATSSTDTQHTTMMATSSADGVQWANPTSLQTVDNGFDWSDEMGTQCVKLSATQTGAIATWCAYNPVDNSRSLWSARMPDATHPFWLSPVTDFTSAPSVTVQSTHLIEKSNGDVVQTFWQQNGGNPVLKSMTWSQANKTWSTPTILYTAASEWTNGTGISASNGKLFALAWTEYTNGTDDTVKSLVFNDGVPGVVSTMRSAAGDGSNNVQLYDVSVAADSTVTVAFWNYNTRKTFMVEQVPGGVATTTEVPLDLTWNYGTRISEDSLGNLTLLGYWVPDTGGGNNDLVVYQKARATSPVFTGSLKVSGKAKAKTKLSASAVSFASISGVSPTSYQWYSCTKIAKKAPIVLPKSCKAIKTAKKASYTVGKTDAKKFILVSVSSANTLGMTTVFSPSTAVVK